MIPINPSDTRLWKYIRVLANICERAYLAEFKATFPKFHQMTLDESDSEDDDEEEIDDDSSSDSGIGIGIGIEEGVLHTFADLVHDRLKATAATATTRSNMHSFIKALPRSLAKRRFKYICELAPYFPDFSDRSIKRHFATYAVLPAFIIRWLHRSPIDFRMLTVKDGKQTVPMRRHGQQPYEPIYRFAGSDGSKANHATQAMLTWRELWNGDTPISLKTTEAYATGAAWFLAAAHNTLQSQYDNDDNHPALRQIKREQRVAKELRELATQNIAAKQAGRDKTMGGHVSSLPDAWLDKLINDVAIMRNIYIHMLICAPGGDRQTHDVIMDAKDLYMASYHRHSSSGTTSWTTSHIYYSTTMTNTSLGTSH